MKVFGVVGTAVVFLAFSAASGFAQQAEEHPRQEEAKPEHPQGQRPEGKQEHPQQEHPQAQRPAPKQDNHAQQAEQKRAQENAKSTQDNQHRAQQDQQHAREAQQHQAQQNQKVQQQRATAQSDQQRRAQEDRNRQANDNHPRPQDHNRSQGRPAAYHGRIPEQNFHQHFGSEHHFRFHRPEMYQGRPRFQYGGYSFYIADPWPSAWSYDDDVYVDYVDDQYYLYDPVHPGMRIVINVDL